MPVLRRRESRMGLEEEIGMVSRNFLYFAIGALAILGVALAYQSYQERQRTTGLHIDLGDGGMSVQSK